MKVYRIFYQFAGIQSSLIMRHYVPSAAFSAAEVMLQPGARAIGIEEVMP